MERTIDKEGGMVEVSAPDLPVGTEVEVIVRVDEEMDATEYLLSTEANRKYLRRDISRIKTPGKIYRI
ncbi:hypothetical protein BH10ACI1_BH10ACI1_20760 [soil metagenome]